MMTVKQMYDMASMILGWYEGDMVAARRLCRRVPRSHRAQAVERYHQAAVKRNRAGRVACYLASRLDVSDI